MLQNHLIRLEIYKEEGRDKNKCSTRIHFLHPLLPAARNKTITFPFSYFFSLQDGLSKITFQLTRKMYYVSVHVVLPVCNNKLIKHIEKGFFFKP